jgi:hypothetical protein
LNEQPRLHALSLPDPDHTFPLFNRSQRLYKCQQRSGALALVRNHCVRLEFREQVDIGSTERGQYPRS